MSLRSVPGSRVLEALESLGVAVMAEPRSDGIVSRRRVNCTRHYAVIDRGACPSVALGTTLLRLVLQQERGHPECQPALLAPVAFGVDLVVARRRERM